LAKRKRLKLSTFKIRYEGHKIGELFIKLSVDISIQNGISEIYLTHFTESEDRLVELISEYGFYKTASNSRGEDIFLKKLVADRGETTDLAPAKIAVKFYPSFYDGMLVRKFVVPIRPEYHNRLFTDFPERQLTLSESAGEFIIEGNTIKKAYICHSKIRGISPGDILLFYLSVRKKLTSLGITESVFTGKQDSDSILKYVGKRSVYSLNEIVMMAKRPVMVILFKHHFHLKNPLNVGRLNDMGVLIGSPQSITPITDESYAKVKIEGGIDGRFTIN